MSRLAQILKAHGELLVEIAAEIEAGRLRGDEDPPFVNVAEAAALARVSTRTINREIREGRLPARGTRRNATIARADVLGWIGSRPARIVRMPVAVRNQGAAAEEADLERRIQARLVRASASQADSPTPTSRSRARSTS